MTNDETRVEWLNPADGKEGDLVDRLTDLVNAVYATAESGLWADGATRTTASELIALISTRQIAIAVQDGRLVGSVQIHDVAPDVSEFGMLVAAPERRGTGIGRALLAFAEQDGRARGLRAMQGEAQSRLRRSRAVSRGASRGGQLSRPTNAAGQRGGA